MNNFDNRSDYELIDSLFSNYLKALLADNNEISLLTYRQKLIDKMYRVALKKRKYVLELTETSTIHKYLTNPEIFIKKIDECMTIWKQKNDYHGFAAYTFKSIYNGLATDSQCSKFDNTTQGMKVSENYRKLQAKLRSLYKTFSAWRKSNISDSDFNEQFIVYSMQVLNIKKESVQDFLNPKQTESITITNKDGEEIDLSDEFGGDSSYLATNLTFSNDSIESTFGQINKLWLSQKQNSKPVLSESLTLNILKKIDSGELQFPENSIEGYISQLKKYDFIHPDLVSAYFIRKEDLPTQQSIGEKYGLSKAGITKKLERFLNDI